MYLVTSDSMAPHMFLKLDEAYRYLESLSRDDRPALWEFRSGEFMLIDEKL